MVLAVVRPGRRLGTNEFFPAACTGWNETADGANSSRVLFCTTCRLICGWTPARSAWHLKHTSYSYCTRVTVAPDAFTPPTAPSFGDASGATAVPDSIVCG